MGAGSIPAGHFGYEQQAEVTLKLASKVAVDVRTESGWLMKTETKKTAWLTVESKAKLTVRLKRFIAAAAVAVCLLGGPLTRAHKQA